MSEISRREALKTLAVSAGTAAISLNQPLFAAEKGLTIQTEKNPTVEEIAIKPLPFDPKKLRGISEKMIQSHWENNYAGAVKTLNIVNKKMESIANDKEVPAFEFNGLKREHLMRTGSVVLHDLYFGNLGGNGKSGGDIETTIKKNFKDFNTWESEFRKIAQGLSGGSGWIILGYNYHLKRLENYWSSDHMHNAAGAVPLLVMDMYEHSYQMDYGAAAAKYIDAFFQNINWESVETRFQKTKNFKWI